LYLEITENRTFKTKKIKGRKISNKRV